MDELKIIENLKKDIKLKIGRSLDAPADFDFLSMQIKMELHEYISPTTLKRFFNYITSDVKPRVSTMSLLARFVGAAGWQDYCNEFYDSQLGSKQGEEVDEKESVGAKNEMAKGSAPSEELGGFTDIKEFHTSADGYSAIYKAKRHGRWHTLKTLRKEFKGDKVYMDLLYNEFNNVYLRTHPNLVRSVGYEIVGDLGECIIMEYVEGENIIDYTKNNGLGSEQVLSLVKELAVVIDFIHENGLVHNNIKSENVLITYDGGYVKLMDFAKSSANFYVKYKEYPDLGAFVELVKEISSILPAGLPRLKQMLRRYEEAKKAQEIIKASELVEILREKVNFLPLIFSVAVVFSALMGSILTYQISGNSGYGKHVYIDSVHVDGKYVSDVSSAIVIFDTISKIVEDHALKVSKNLYKRVDTISDRTERFVEYSKAYRSLVKNKAVYPVKVLNKYLPKDCPEYNLYKSTLVQMTEDVYSKFYHSKVDSLRNTK